MADQVQIFQWHHFFFKKKEKKKWYFRIIQSRQRCKSPLGLSGSDHLIHEPVYRATEHKPDNKMATGLGRERGGCASLLLDLRGTSGTTSSESASSSYPLSFSSFSFYVWYRCNHFCHSRQPNFSAREREREREYTVVEFVLDVKISTGSVT